MIKTCLLCGEKFDVQPKNFKLAKWCPKCRPTAYREQTLERSRIWHREKRKTNPEYAREYSRQQYIKQKLKVLRGEAAA